MKKTRRLRNLLCAALLLLPVASVLLAGCSGNKSSADDLAKAPVAPVVKVARRNISDTLNIASEFLPYQEIDVYAKVSGYIRQLNVDWGTRVHQGEVMAVLEVPELEEQIELDQASVRRSQNDLERSREELNRSQSAYDVAHITYTRLAEVQKSQPELVAQEEIDIAKGKDLEASASVSGAKDGLAGAEQALAVARAALAKDQALFDYTRITAPFDGVVTRIDAYKGALLPAGTSSNKGDLALCHLSQNNLLRLVIPVPERAVPDIHIGQTISVDVSALKKSFDGKIVRLSDQIDPETRTMHTEVQVTNPSYEIVPGMYASVELPLHSAAGVLSLPVQAIHSTSEEKGNVLFVGPDNHVQPREITIGLRGASWIEVLSGLQEGDQVIFGEQASFTPGQLVKPTLAQTAETE